MFVLCFAALTCHKEKRHSFFQHQLATGMFIQPVTSKNACVVVRGKARIACKVIFRYTDLPLGGGKSESYAANTQPHGYPNIVVIEEERLLPHDAVLRADAMQRCQRYAEHIEPCPTEAAHPFVNKETCRTARACASARPS